MTKAPSIYVDGCPSVPIDLLIPQEDFNLEYLDLESTLVKGDVITKTSSSSHHPLCPIVCNASICDGDILFSSSSSSNELTS